MVDAALNAGDAPNRPGASGRLSAHERIGALVLFALALAARLFVLADYEAHHPQALTPVIDEASYDSWARRIAAGDWRGEGVFFQEPLYPYLLGGLYALAGPSLHVARVAQCVLGAATAVLVLLLARRAFGRGAGWAAGIGWAIYRPALWFPTLLLKENVFCLAFAALALALVAALEKRDAHARWHGLSPGRWLAVGVCGGLGALLRGNLLPMLAFIALFPAAAELLARRRFARAALQGALVFAGAALVLAPVALRNQLVGGEFALSTSGIGTNLYGGNNLDNPLGVAAQFDWVRTVPEHEADDWRHEAERRTGRALTAVETSEFWLGETLASVRREPWEHAKILGRKLLATLGAYEVPDNHFLEWDARHVAALALPFPGFAVVGLAGLVGIALFLARRAGPRPDDPATAPQVAPAVLLALFVLYLGSVVLTVTSDRIRWPLIVLLLPFAGHLVAQAIHWVRSERRVAPRLAVTLVLAAAASSAIVFAPVVDARERAEDFDERDYNLAVELLRSKQSLAAVEKLALELAARHPDDPDVELLRAQIEAARGLALRELAAHPPPGRESFAREAGERARRETGTALERLARVTARGNPVQRHRADAAAGALLAALGRFAEAEECFARALDFDPADADLLRRHAVASANAAMALAPGEPRSAKLAAAARALRALPGSATDPELAALIASIEAAR